MESPKMWDDFRRIHKDPVSHLRHVTAAGLLSASCGSAPKIIEDLPSLAGWWLTYPSEK